MDLIHYIFQASSADAWSQVLEMLERGETEEQDKPNSSDQSEQQSEVDENRDTFANKSFQFYSDDSVDLNGTVTKVDESMIPDDYDKLVKIFRRANLIRDGARNQAHRNSFKGEDFVNFIMRERHVSKFFWFSKV
jgi:hypothetical protein